MPIYNEQQVSELNREASEIPTRVRRLLLDMNYRNLNSELAREYFQHGFVRRMTTISRCVQNVFELIPPDFDRIPDTDTRKNTEVSIQSFVFNISGALDNLAWVWVEETGLRRENGQPLRRNEVGLHSQCRLVRASFSEEFQQRLQEFDAWYEVHLSFRHALAHRIPLYIPPYCIDPGNAAEYRRWEEVKTDALRQINVDAYERAEAAQEALAHFQPSMTHSITENVGNIAFHAQMIADFNTVDDVKIWLLRDIEARMARDARGPN